MSLLLTAAHDYRIVAVSDDFVASVGVARDALVGRSVLDALAGRHATHGQTMDKLRASLDRVVATGRRDVMEMQRYDLASQGDSVERQWWPVNAPVLGDDGALAFIVHRVEDATPLVRAQHAEADERAARVAVREGLQAVDILESITEGFFALDHDWRFTYVNHEAQRILDSTREDLLGKSILDVYPTLAGTEFERQFRRGLDERHAATFTAWYAEQQSWYEVHSFPSPTGISVYLRDVTAARDAEAEREALIAESERQRRMYEAALSNTPDLVYVFDRAHRFIYANEALLAMWGRTRDEALGLTCLELGYEPWHAAMHDREIEEVVATRRPIRGEVPFTGTNGRRIYDYIFAPVIGEGGDVVAVAGTTRDVTERQQVEQSIQEQAAQLKEADRAKDEFLATLAHELRNPLAPLRNGIYLLRRKGGVDASVARVHDMMQRQVDHLVRLVDDLLETSRISRGALALRTEPVDIATIVRNAVETSRPLIDAGRHALRIVLPEDPVEVSGDPVRIAQILSNLLNNAATYTPPGGHVDLVVAHGEDGVAITVGDDGAGIARDDLPRIFAMFRRGETSPSGQSGLGIGLALSRKLAELHGGTLDAASDGLGRGSTFTLRLPALALAAPLDEPASAAAFAFTDPVDLRETRMATGTGDGAAQRVLVVDDNRDAADSLGMVLRMLGAHVAVVSDGPSALEAFDAHAPEVVLLDIGMPGMDGYEVARVIRARDPSRRTALVALTGWGQDTDRRRARDAGFDHHLVKPADMGDLQRLLTTLRDGAPAS